MICRLCLKNVNQGFDLFENEGKKKKAAFIIAKHFWFEPKPGDGLSCFTCWKCWNNVIRFNSFYIQIQKAHKTFLEHIPEVTETPDISKNMFNNSKKNDIEKVYNKQKQLDITELVETILIDEDAFDGISETSSIADLNHNEISSFNDCVEDEKLKLNIEVPLKKNQSKIQFKSEGIEKRIQKRKCTEDITVINKKLADKDNIAVEELIDSKNYNFMSDLETMKTRFNNHVHLLKTRKGKNHQLFTKEEYNSLLVKVKEIKNKVSGKTPEEYLKLTRYDVIKIESFEKLIVPIRNEKSPIIYYTFLEDYFQIIHETHIAIGHGGRNRMMKELKTIYKNITAEVVMTYLRLCEPCQKNGHSQKKNPLLD